MENGEVKLQNTEIFAVLYLNTIWWSKSSNSKTIHTVRFPSTFS